MKLYLKCLKLPTDISFQKASMSASFQLRVLGQPSLRKRQKCRLVDHGPISLRLYFEATWQLCLLSWVPQASFCVSKYLLLEYWLSWRGYSLHSFTVRRFHTDSVFSQKVPGINSWVIQWPEERCFELLILERSKIFFSRQILSNRFLHKTQSLHFSRPHHRKPPARHPWREADPG